MTYIEIKADLFSVLQDYYLAHCISADYKMGAGIAKDFEARFKLRSKLKQMPVTAKYRAMLVGRVFNLVTKEKYWHKPTYDSVRAALEDMKRQCQELNIKKLAMPRIASGLDRLSWPRVSEIVRNVFEDTDITIMVCVK